MSFRTSESAHHISPPAGLQLQQPKLEGAANGADDLGGRGTQSPSDENESVRREAGPPGTGRDSGDDRRQFLDDTSGNGFSNPGSPDQPKGTSTTSSEQDLEGLMAQGRLLFLQFDDSGIIGEIDKAIETWTRAFSLAPDGEIDKLRCLTNLGCSYESRFNHVGQLSDVDKAIDFLTQAALLIPKGHVFEPAILNNLGHSHLSRFEHMGKFKDIDEAIKHLDKTVSDTADGNADKPARLNNLGAAYHRRFEHLGQLTDINTAVDYQVEAVTRTPDGHPGLPGYLNNLGNSYISRFEYLDKEFDLDAAIECQAKAVSLTVDGHANKPKRLNNLGISYSHRFERLGNLSDIDEAISCQVKAVHLTPRNHPDMPGWLNNLGSSYESRFQHLTVFSDLDAAINHQAQAVSLTDDSHPDMPQYRSNLGGSYVTRFLHVGELSDLNQAILCLVEASLSTPEDYSTRPVILNNLGTAYHYRFRHLGELSDLNKAIECIGQAVSLTPIDHAFRQAYLVNLEGLYLRRFGRLGKHSDIANVIECRQAAALVGAHTNKQVMLKSFANDYLGQVAGVGELPALNEIIDSLAGMVSSIPDSHVTKSQTLNNLGLCYQYQFERSGERSDLDKAIAYLGQALSLTPDGHPANSRRLYILGDSYLKRFEHQSMPQDIDSAITYFSKSAQSNIGSSRFRFRASRRWARLSSQHCTSSRKIAYERTMELLTQLVWLGTTTDRRYQLLEEIGDVSTEAASCAIELGDYNLAVEWLESGRSIVWGQLLQLRTPFDELLASDPELAQKLKQVSLELENEGNQSLAPSSSKDLEPGQEEALLLTNNQSKFTEESTRYQDLALEWDLMIQRARAIPGFENFMRPRKATELMHAAQRGPVAVINVHASRCDALILSPNCNDIAHIPLKNFSLKKAVDAQEYLVQGIGNHLRCFKKKANNQQKIRESWTLEQILEMIWYDLVKPVLDFLGYTRELPVDKLPYLTWCTTGPLSFFPLHAAGCYGSSQPNTLDLVISSYTPTLSTLLTPTAQVSVPCSGILAVGQEWTKGLPPLPYTRAELRIIEEYAKAARYLQLDGHHATVDAVLNAMEEYSWVHLACHAVQRKDNPGQSTFHLHDGDLMLSRITTKSFKNKGLAFLSACQTARGDEKLPNEAVHLAAGMLMAGYPSVIATMWPIFDEDGPKVAKHVYAELLCDGKLDCTRAARALHKAVRVLRESVGIKAFERWAPFIHIGL